MYLASHWSFAVANPLLDISETATAVPMAATWVSTLSAQS
ncbi:hypothetical protein JCM19231_2679 [Vibrio ishigakensis]|uniref:Uncharacterized protein n=1 Tax=Vibrio ishigakensis TaxID=1481914 RepID=A0A0B8NSQ1_9VIBR|nr:hypothetical protein JCM19231_2679 [Vibrio ishigakensis]